MTQNLEYIYQLRDRYSKKLSAITRKQLAFTNAYRKSMGKVNAAAMHHGRIVAKNTQVYNSNKQAMARVNSHLNILTQSQSKYAKASSRRITKLNQEWRKHGKVIQAAQVKQKKQGPGLAGMATGVGGGFFLKSILDTSAAFYENLNAMESVGRGAINMDRMKKKALEWGISTKFSAVQVAGAMREAAQTGMKENQILSSMPGNLALAAAGQMGLVEAMILSTDVVNQFKKTVGNLEIADLLAAGAGSSTSKVIELGAALKNVGTTAFQTGLTAKDTVKMLMAIGETGLRGEIGGTMLMNMLVQMKKMPKKLRGGFKKFLSGTGVALGDIINVETGKLIDPDKLSKLLITADQIQLNALQKSLEIRGGKALGSLANVSLAKMAEFDEVLETSAGRAEIMKGILMKGLPGGLTLLDSAWTTSKIIMIDSFVVPLSEAMRAIAKFLIWLMKSHTWVLKFAFVLISLTTVIGAVGIAAWVLGGAFGNLLIVGGLLKAMFLKNTWAIVGQKIATYASATATGVWTAAKWLLVSAFSASTYQMIAQKIILISHGIAMVMTATYTGMWTAAQWLLNTALNASTWKLMLVVGAIILLSPIILGVILVIGYWTAAQWLLNIALNANPIGLIVGAIAILVGLMVWAYKKTGSLGNAFKAIGGIIMKALLTPINLVISAIRGLFYVASLLPGKMGKFFGKAHEMVGRGQDAANLALSGNKSQTVFGQMYDTHTQGDKSSTWMDQQTQQAAQARTEYVTKPVEINGNIGVSAEPGSKVTKSKFSANVGNNMYTLGGVH